MVPAAFVVLPALPLTPNGKLDRRALPAPGPARPDLATPFLAPRTRTEESITAIWREVLGLEAIGVHDNFFDLGGHSLLATQIIARVREQFQVDPALRVLFDEPTVAALAHEVDRSRVEIGASSRERQRTPELVAVARSSRRMRLSDLEHGGIANTRRGAAQEGDGR
jgi:acyl carrier protein